MAETDPTKADKIRAEAEKMRAETLADHPHHAQVMWSIDTVEKINLGRLQPEKKDPADGG